MTSVPPTTAAPSGDTEAAPPVDSGTEDSETKVSGTEVSEPEVSEPEGLADQPSVATASLLTRLRLSLPALITLAAISLLLGIGPIIITLTTVVPLLALPAAAGLPFLIPALHLWPLGASTWGFWVVDVIAAIVMLVIVAMRLVNSQRRHPNQGRVRRFFSAWSAVILGVVVGNLVRGVFASFVVNADLATYGGYLLANIIVSALFGTVVGLLPAIVAALVPLRQRQRQRQRQRAEPTAATVET